MTNIICLNEKFSTIKVYEDWEQYTNEETGTRYKYLDKPNRFDEKVTFDFTFLYGTSKESVNISKIKELIGCELKVSKEEEVMKKMIEWVAHVS